MRRLAIATLVMTAVAGCGGEESNGGITRSEAEASARADFSPPNNPDCGPIKKIACRPHADGWTCTVTFKDGNTINDFIHVATGPETGSLC